VQVTGQTSILHPAPEGMIDMSKTTVKEEKVKATSNQATNKKGCGGRPTKYRHEYAQQAYKLALEGFTDKKIAGFFKVKERTINNWKDKHPEFFQSLKRGKDDFDTNVIERILAKRATGYQYTEVTRAVSKEVDPSTGKAPLVTVKEVTKEVSPDPTSIIFWLKNRQPERWRDKQSIDLGFNAETLNAILTGLPTELAEAVRTELGKLVSSK
jgi:hypothetical protein